MASTILRTPVTDACAWRGPDLAADRSWIWQLDGEELAEIDAALRAVTRRDLRPGEFAREDFPLDRLAARLQRLLGELEDGRGFVLLRGLEVLYRGFRLDLRGEVREGVNAEVTPEPAPVYSYFAEKLSINFNARMIRTGQEKIGRELEPLESAAIDTIIALARDPAMRLDMDFRPGDIQFLNNYVILHSRTGWEDHDDPQQRRALLRLWLNVPNARALAPDFHGDARRVAKHDITRRVVQA